MQIFVTSVTLFFYGIWLSIYGKGMIKAREWPDLVTSLVMLLISLVYAMVYIWDLNTFFPTQALMELFMPLIDLVYADWL